MKTKTGPWRHIYHDIEIPRPKNRDIEKRRQLTHDIVIPRHFFRGQKATTSRFQGRKTTASRFQDQKAKTSGFRGTLTLHAPWYRKLVHIPAFNISSFLCRFIPRSFTPQCLRAPLIFRNDNSLIMRRECLATEIVETKHLAGITEE